MTPIAPGAHILLCDAVWRVVRIDRTSTGSSAWRCVGVSEIVRDQDAIFLEEFEHPKEVTVLDPRETRLERDTSTQHRAGLRHMPVHRVGCVWKFKLSEVDGWVRVGGADVNDEPRTRGGK